MSNIYESILQGLDNDIISYDIVESVFLTLQYENKENIREIIKGVINFLKENNLTEGQIRRTLKRFFLLRKDYIFVEFGIRYANIGEIVEELITPVVQQNESDSNGSESTEHSESNENQQTQQPLNTHFSNLFNIQYMDQEPFNHQLYNQNLFNTNIFGQTTQINTLNQSTIDVVNSLLGGHQQNIEYIQQPIYMHFPINQLAGDFGLALNMFNIILQNPPINAPHMEDVKNVINSEELSKLPIKTLAEVDNEKHKACPICLEDYNKESQLRILKCEHSFHPDCIDKWLTDCDYKCPVCRDDTNKHHAEI